MSQYKRATPALNINNPHTKILTMKIILCYLCNMAYCNICVFAFAEKYVSFQQHYQIKVHIINVYTTLRIKYNVGTHHCTLSVMNKL